MIGVFILFFSCLDSVSRSRRSWTLRAFNIIVLPKYSFGFLEKELINFWYFKPPSSKGETIAPVLCCLPSKYTYSSLWLNCLNSAPITDPTQRNIDKMIVHTFWIIFSPFIQIISNNSQKNSRSSPGYTPSCHRASSSPDQRALPPAARPPNSPHCRALS